MSALTVAGLAIGVALLLRYSALPVALALGGAFWWIARARDAVTAPHGEHRGAQRAERDRRALATLLAYAAPALFPVGLWVLVAALAGTPPHELLSEAWALSALAADDPALLAEARRLDGDPLALGRWLGRWAVGLAPLSIAALGWLALRGVRRGGRPSGAAGAPAHGATGGGRALAGVWLVLTSIALTQPLAMLLGPAQPWPLHLTPLVVPAFVAIALLERQASGGRRPARYQRGRRRRQAALAAALVAGSLAALPALGALPAWEAAAQPLRAATRGEVPAAAAAPADARAIAAWIEARAGRGELLVDPERHAPVLAALAGHDSARLAGGAELRRLAGLAPEEPGAHAVGGPALRLALEAGEYLLYERRSPPATAADAPIRFSSQAIGALRPPHEAGAAAREDGR